MNAKYYKGSLEQITVSVGASVKDVLKLFQTSIYQIVLVVDGEERLVGIVAESDIPSVYGDSEHRYDNVEDIMNVGFSSGSETMSQGEIVEFMTSKAITRLPIVDEFNHVVDMAILTELRGSDVENIPYVFSNQLDREQINKIVETIPSVSGDQSMEMLDLQFENMSWLSMDYIYRYLSRKLKVNEEWRYGDIRTLEWIKKSYQPFGNDSLVVDKTFCDMGCGVYHALGVGVFMYINGADSFYSTDISGCDEPRAAEALADMLVSCRIFPEKWHWSNIPRDEFFKRVDYFDIRALVEGNLRAGLKCFAEHYLVEDFYHSSIPDESVDLLSSVAVFEHFDDVASASRQMYRIMKPGGYLYHDVDLRDHRWWNRPDIYTPWSFLTTDKPHRNEMSNRLRANELLAEFTNAGFEIVLVERVKESLPDGLRKQLVSRYQSYSEEELETVQLKCMLTKALAS